MFQRTLAASCTFSGKGLHTGTHATMTVCPAPEDTGIVFRRTDMDGATIHAVASNVSSTQRSTTLSEGGAVVHTVEHLLSALTGLGVDNAEVLIDNVEVPILDGSASYYLDAFAKAGTVGQSAPRRMVSVSEVVEIKDEKTGSWVRISPAEEPSYSLTVDFGSRVLGVQSAQWDGQSASYAEGIGPCRTFVFFHEIEFLFANNLIKGGDVDNAIVIVEHPVSDERIEAMARSIGRPGLKVTESGYLDNLQLHFPNECGRHKLLDLIGDLRLCGGFLQARVEAYKPGHGINSRAAAAVVSSLG